jgi:hypothetical protein
MFPPQAVLNCGVFGSVMVVIITKILYPIWFFRLQGHRKNCNIALQCSSSVRNRRIPAFFEAELEAIARTAGTIRMLALQRFCIADRLLAELPVEQYATLLTEAHSNSLSPAFQPVSG